MDEQQPVGVGTLIRKQLFGNPYMAFISKSLSNIFFLDAF